jgi:hypothetical protein|tara:strand:+ start:9 stop:1358 length:1350 start_codon:yes stop_codon:yes gene_type:complete
MTANVGKAAEAGFIKEISISSNAGEKAVSLQGGFFELKYYESIMANTVKATLIYTDSGDTIDGKTARSGLPIVTTEMVTLKFEDNNKNTLEFSEKKNNELYVKKVTPLVEDTRSETVGLTLVSAEDLTNTKVNLKNRFDGKISESVNRILTEGNFKGLGTKKKVDIESTTNSLNKIPNNKHPFYWLNKFSSQAVSETTQKLGESAGYFFFETSEGFFFKSIDSLLDQKPKKSFVYNETPDSRGTDVPESYDGKALDMQSDNRIDAVQKSKMGTNSNRIVTFDPFTTYYEVSKFKSQDFEQGYKKAGKNLPKLNTKFENPDVNEEYSRTTYYILDTGTLPTGNDTKEQIKKSSDQNFEVAKISNQSMMRYNLLFSQQITLTIPADLSLHAGDAIFVDTPEIKDNKNDTVDRQQGGLYIISDLCHYIASNKSLTKMNLVRESFGRKPKSSN